MNYKTRSILILSLFLITTLSMSMIFINSPTGMTTSCEIKCTKNLDCNDNIETTEDICYEPNTCASFCQNSEN